MDLPFPSWIKETKKKLEETYCIINDKLYLIQCIEESSILCHDGNKSHLFTDENIKSFEVFLPETGVYKCDNTYIYLTKYPKRQWSKSFNWNFYKKDGKGTLEILPFFIYKNLHTRQDLWKDNESVFYLKEKIGAVLKDGTIKLMNTLYKQEVIDRAKVDPEWIMNKH